MALNRLKANICGTTYTLVSEESLSYMRDLVAQVDAQMSEIVTGNARMSTTMAAVLTAIDNADKANKESRAAEDLRLQLKRMVDDTEHLKDQLAAAREEVSRLYKETMEMRAKLPTSAAPAVPVAPAAPKQPTPPEPTDPATLFDFEEILDDEEDI